VTDARGRAGLGRWLGRRSAGARPAQAERRCPSDPRRRYDATGDYLFARGLTPSERNYGLVNAYLAGEPAVVARFDALERDGALDDEALAALAAERDDRYDEAVLADFAEQLARQMAACLAAAARFAPSARALSAEVQGEAAAIRADPAATLDRLVMLTRELADAATSADAELTEARGEVETLRVSLDQARRAAEHDHLTGLPNRRHFEDQLRGRRGKDAASVALCDLDGFKGVNDEHGHEAGDRVLRFFADRLRRALADRALVARYGGEEFVCLFDQAGPEDARAALDAFRHDLGKRSLVNRQTGKPFAPLTFSAGVAPVDADPRDALRRADAGLYDAKRAGRNRVVVTD